MNEALSEENVGNQCGTSAGSSDSSEENSSVSASEGMRQWFPYDDCFKVDEKTLSSSNVMSILSPYVADERKKKFKEVIANRTYSVCIAVEGLLELGNISAVFRSADALGFQSVHVISNDTKKK